MVSSPFNPSSNSFNERLISFINVFIRSHAIKYSNKRNLKSNNNIGGPFLNFGHDVTHIELIWYLVHDVINYRFDLFLPKEMLVNCLQNDIYFAVTAPPPPPESLG